RYPIACRFRLRGIAAKTVARASIAARQSVRPTHIPMTRPYSGCQLTWYGITLYGAIDARASPTRLTARRLIRAALRGPHTSSRDIARGRDGALHRTGCKIHSSASKGLSRSAGTPLWSLLWRLRPLLVETLQWTGIGGAQRRHSPEPANLVG